MFLKYLIHCFYVEYKKPGLFSQTLQLASAAFSIQQSLFKRLIHAATNVTITVLRYSSL